MQATALFTGVVTAGLGLISTLLVVLVGMLWNLRTSWRDEVFTKVDGVQETLGTKVDGVQETLGTKIDALTKTVDNLVTSIATIDKRVFDSTTVVKGVETTTRRLEPKSDAFGERIGKLETGIGKLETRADGLDSKLDRWYDEVNKKMQDGAAVTVGNLSAINASVQSLRLSIDERTDTLRAELRRVETKLDTHAHPPDQDV